MGCAVSKKSPLSPRHQRALTYAMEMIKKSEFAKYVTDVYLFGSCARKEAKWSSDIDLLLSLKQDARSLPDFSIKIHELKGSISEDSPDSVETDLKVVIGDEWKNSSSLFYKNIRRDGISVWR